ncbi:MAG: class I SAM-dependent methyltransferase [Anaeromyxobacteraceae bacterium]
MNAAPALEPGCRCGHSEGHLVPRFGARDYVTGEHFEVAGCSRCGLDVTTPAPDAAAMGAYYPPSYYGRPGARRFPLAVEEVQRLLYRRRVRQVERLAGGRGRVLDIGCGPGLLLEAFRRRGWEVHGTELSDTAAARARSIGIPVQVGALDAWPWPDGHFDAVTLWHVLEHWADPATVLAQVARLLRPGGAAMVAVPNFGSIEAQLTRDGWFHLDVPRHLVHFTPGSLERALAAAGLVVQRRSFGALEYDTLSFVQSVLNRAGVRHNLLYNLLRGRDALQDDAGSWIPRLATLAAAVPLWALAVPVTSVLNLARTGSAVTLHAVRRG